MVQQCRQCGQVHDLQAGCALVHARAGNPMAVRNAELVGSVVAERYRIGGVLGQGTSGTVFLVESLGFGRTAVMKVLRPRYAIDDIVSDVFHREARRAWLVHHPCLCEVFDAGLLPDGAPFFVMERLEGEPLASRIERAPLSLAAAVDVVMQLLSALDTIHAHGLLVGDLRPHNLFLAQRRGCRPLLKVLDFGLAGLIPLAAVRAEWSRADFGPARDLAYYLSPERTRGDHALDPTSDLFAVGAILYEALTGERPFDAASLEGIVHQIGQGEHVPMHARRSDVSVELSEFVSRALSPVPGARPGSAKQMQDDLRAIFEPGRSRSSTSTYAVPLPVPAPSPVDAPSPEASRSDPWSGAAAERRPAEPPRGGDVYDDETQTKREFGLHDAVARTLASVPADDISTDSMRVDSSLLPDEASADNADRTVPPPRNPEVSVEFDVDVSGLGIPSVRVDDIVEEETETMRLTPELRRRLEHLMAAQRTPKVSEPGALPTPPTPQRVLPLREGRIKREDES